MNDKIKEFLDENIEKTVKYSPEGKGNLIGLPYPYTVPCVTESFQELYYWDTYFTNVGLLLLGKTKYVKNNIEDIFFLVEKYGFMPNGSRTYYLNRSQPPFLSQMVRDLFDVTEDKKWLLRAYGVLEIEYDFWQTKRMTPLGLNGYTGYEIWKDLFDHNLAYFSRRTGYKPDCEVNDEHKKKIYLATVSVCESGWDCNSRVKSEGHDYCMIDLNSLLYAMESNMLYFSSVLELGKENVWEQRLRERRRKMQLLWNDGRKLFMDYNFKTGRFSDYATVASFYPMYANIATDKQAQDTVKLFDLLNLDFGISAGEPNSDWKCQWDYPNVWAPLQFIIYKALINYGYDDMAKTVAEKYVHLVENNFEKTGNLWEKYDGNTGEKACFEYSALPMVGWTAGVYIFFNKELGIL